MAAKSHRALKITSIVIGAIVAVALIAVVALNIYMRVAFAPFFDRAESPFDIPGINTGFVPQDLDHVEADDSWLFSGYMADHSPSPIYRRAADGTIAKFYVALPDGSAYDGHGSAITTNEQGIRVVDTDKCIGCGACHEACPWHMPTVNPETGKSSKCIACGACVAGCPSGALSIVDWDAVTSAAQAAYKDL